jgi:hypothetical protein
MPPSPTADESLRKAFDEAKHPRGPEGRWRKALLALRAGQTLDAGDGTVVRGAGVDAVEIFPRGAESRRHGQYSRGAAAEHLSRRFPIRPRTRRE